MRRARKPVTFVDGRGQITAPRIPAEVWESHKDVILSKYGKMTLKEVMAFMETEHGFKATRRQYVHRFLKSWKVGKYKRTTRLERSPLEDSPVDSGDLDPRLASRDATLRYPWLAEMLHALGDPGSSFAIHAGLYKSQPSSANIVACAGTARTTAQANAVIALLSQNIEGMMDLNNNTWAKSFVRLLAAHMYHRADFDIICSILQVEGLIGEMLIFDDEGPEFRLNLAPRSPRLDLSLYALFASGLGLYNEGTIYEEGDDEIDKPQVLDLFINQQPAFPNGLGEHTHTDPLLELGCIRSCLDWCLQVLNSGLVVPHEILPVNGNRLTQVYAVLCTIWRFWLGVRLPWLSSSTVATSNPALASFSRWNETLEAQLGTSPTVPPNPYLTAFSDWTDTVEAQLGISPTHFLTIMVCMIMAEAFHANVDVGNNPVSTALQGALALKRLNSIDLIRRLLNQALSSDLLWAPPSSEEDAPDGHREEPTVGTEVMRRYREFVIRALRIDNPPTAELEAAFEPLTLAIPGAPLHTRTSLL